MTRLHLTALVLLASPASAAAAPNILLLYVDNLGYGDLPSYGAQTGVITPHLDQLARDGVRCTDFYVVTSSCTPSRGALLTGRYPRRNGLTHQLSPDENQRGIGLPHRERILPQYLREAGYASGCFGKWNIGFAEGSRPTDRGFNEFLGFRSGNVHYFKHLYHGQMDLRRGTEPEHRRGEYITDLCADQTIDFISRHRDQPWLAYVPFNAVHFVSKINTEPGEEPEWQVPAKYLEQYGLSATEPDPQKRFFAVLTALDDAIGRILGALDEHHLAENTLVAMISDNGAFMLKDRGLEVQSNAPLRNGGTTVYEGGVRVPAIFRWPGKIPAGTVCGVMLSHLDIAPLCLSLAGLPPHAGRVIDGKDPLPALRGQTQESPHPFLAFDYNHHQGLRSGDWKIVRPGRDKPWELYNLARDIGESDNLAASNPNQLQQLLATFQAWETQVQTDASPPSPKPEPQAAR
jgi:arylsulfatase A